MAHIMMRVASSNREKITAKVKIANIKMPKIMIVKSRKSFPQTLIFVIIIKDVS